ncbi:MAG TPA: peptidoglycan editing factor PgeF [Actinobacteria bacterium]|nr:peptidoglycan editing factor PgeF [Actinomycetota bacterium]
MVFKRSGKNGLRFFIPDSLSDGGASVAFTTRVGGVSEKPFDSLNLALHTEDAPAAVLKNRALASVGVDIQPDKSTFTEQVHGDKVVWIAKDMVGAGARSFDTAVPESDAMVTDLRNVALVVLSADCLPIILVEPGKNLIGAAHAGWRGTLAKVVGKTVEMMVEAGADVSAIKAFLGPAIGECCFEVGADVYDRFSDAFGIRPSIGSPRLDLAALNEMILENTGVKSENIDNIGFCTVCHPELFFSWRRDGVTGRQGAFVSQ